jgi:hypothetical protein
MDCLSGDNETGFHLASHLRSMTVPIRASQTSVAFLHNASASLCRLPEEIFVYIIKLAQGRFPNEGAADSVSISVFWHKIDQRHIECLAWREIMLTCTQIRNIALRSPELWSLVASCWPKQWIDLCVKRAGDLPLHFLCNVHSRITSTLATRLIPKARDLVLLVGDPKDVDKDEWHKICTTILGLKSNLRSLSVRFSGLVAWDRDNLVPLSISLLGRHGSFIKNLNLECIQLPDIPAFLWLEHLRLYDVKPPQHPRWIEDWFRTTPKLKTFRLSIRMLDQPHVLLEAASEQLTLPYLSYLHFSGPLEVTEAFFQTIPLPSQRLVITTHPGDYEENTPSLTLSNVTSIHDLIFHIKQFWSRATGREEIPHAEIELHFFTNIPPIITLEMDDGKGPDGFGNVLHFSVRVERIMELGPFVPYVTSCKVRAPSLRRVEWSHMDSLPNLEHVKVAIERFRGVDDAKSLQPWADERAQTGRSPVHIEIGQYGRPPQPGVGGKYHARVLWDPTSGALAEAQWNDISQDDLGSEPESSSDSEPLDDDGDADVDEGEDLGSEDE